MTAPDATPVAVDTTAPPFAPATSGSEPAIILERVSRWYGNVVAVNDISFALAPGVTGLLGKTVTRTPTAMRAQLGLARTFQIVTLFARDSLLHNVKLALMGKSPMRRRHWGSFERDRALSNRALEVLHSVGLADKAQWPLEQTSYGEKRRLEIAMALAQDPQVLLLDEPLAGLSTEERETITELLRNIDPSITIIMIEHDMEVALAFADRITLLHYGEVILAGTRQEVVADPRTREIYLGH